MAIERFLNNYPVNASFTEEIQKESDKGKDSPAEYMAELYIKIGSSDLKEQKEKLIIAVEEKDGEETERLMYSMSIDTYSVMLGASILAIKKMIDNGAFNQFEYNSRLNRAFSSIRSFNFGIRNPEIEVLTPLERTTLARAADRDSTYGDFFDRDFRILPTSLKKQLIRTGFTQYSDLILPDYIQRTSLLISSQQ